MGSGRHSYSGAAWIEATCLAPEAVLSIPAAPPVPQVTS